MTTTQQRISAVSNYTLEYFRYWHGVTLREFKIAAAQLLLASGSGPARIPSCEQTLRHIPFAASKLQQDFAASAPLPRALSLLRAGELRTLRVMDSATLAFILSALAEREGTKHTTRDTAEDSQGFALLHVVEWAQYDNPPNAVFALLERYAANITELNCLMTRQCDAADKLLARCTRVETLTNAQHYTPSAWLQLSQLHTLQWADLSVVSMATISAALPRLHTLGVVSTSSDVPAAAVAGFCEHLLPRLRAFQCIGVWPHNRNGQAAASLCAPQQLPNLRTLKLQGFSDDPPPWTWFMGARPLELCTDGVMVKRWLRSREQPRVDAAAGGFSGVALCPLASVRILQVDVGLLTEFTPPQVARLLRAAPHLETLIVAAKSTLVVESSWPGHPAFDGLVHSKLKQIRVSVSHHLTSPPTPDSLTRLRQRHFPYLRVVAINGREYFVTPLALPSFAQYIFNRCMQFASRLWKRQK
jgi:hypothetical protein